MKTLKQAVNNILKTAFIAMLFVNLISCDKDTPDDPLSKKSHVLVTAVVGGDGMSSANYAQQFNLADMTAGSSLDNSNAIELDAQNNAVKFWYKGSLYLDAYSVNKIAKWDATESGTLDNPTGVTDFSTVIYPSNLAFYTDEIAFTGGAAFKIAIFNPTTMKITGYINLSSISRMGEVAELGTIGLEIVAELIIRDKMMFAAIHLNTTDGNHMPATKSCEVVLIDLDKIDPASTDNSEAIIKSISDTRGSYTGAWGSGGGSYYMVVDENNDIYVLCHNQWSMYSQVTGLPMCVLRIKNGETDFDDGYYFNLDAVTGGNAAIGLEYTGNGKFFAPVQDASQIDSDNAWSFYLDPIYQWYQFDLKTQTGELVEDASFTRGYGISKIYIEEDYAYIPYSTKEENYISKVNITTLNQEKLFTTNGQPIIFKIE